MKKPSSTTIDALDILVKRLASEAKLNSWSSFIETLQVPNDLLPALMSGRSELIKFVEPRALTKEEMATLYKLIAAMLETNRALQTHAEQVAILVGHWAGAFSALRTAGEKIKSFANFKPLYDPEEGDDDTGGEAGPFLGRKPPGEGARGG